MGPVDLEQEIFIEKVFMETKHTYSLQQFSQDYNLASHKTYVVCVNFMHKWRDLQFKVNSDRQIFLRNCSWQFYLLFELLPEICEEKIPAEIFFNI